MENKRCYPEDVERILDVFVLICPRAGKCGGVANNSHIHLSLHFKLHAFHVL